MKTALELLLQAQAKLNADGITEEVAEFCRKFFAGLNYTEDASDYTFTLHSKNGGYYFLVTVTLHSVNVQWDVSKNGVWECIDAKVSWPFKERDAAFIIAGIQMEFETMADRCYVVQPELTPAT